MKSDVDRRDALAAISAIGIAAILSTRQSYGNSREPMPPYNVQTISSRHGLTIYLPEKAEPSPGILLLHGSEGGWNGWIHNQAIYFAMQGFLAFPVPYSRGGNPWHAGDILNWELNTTATDLAELKAHPQVMGRKVGLYGVSRGSEHALLLASLMARDGMPGLPDAVAAHAPSDTVVPAFVGNDWLPGKRPRRAQDQPAWLWKGSTSGLAPGDAIEIERYSGPLFISHGEADDVWPVERSRRLEARLKAAGRNPEIHYYASEGHGFRAETANLQRQRLADFFTRHLA
jgi:dipeptidyl aminopeptidase/acylaminoacyl peptidase